MSTTAKMEINTWVQTENTAVAAQVWEELLTDEAQQAESTELVEPQPAAEEDFWQDWFGLWR